MSLSAAALRKMMELGLSAEQIVELAETLELEQPAPAPVVEPQRSAAAVRQARYRERKASENESATRDVTRDVTRNATGDVTTPLLDKEKSPTPPKEINPTPPPVRSLTRTNVPAPSKSFDRFWLAYPRKVGKGEARKAFAKALGRIPADDPLARIMAALDTAKRAWSDTEAQFIPHASTWLNQDRWDDDPLAQPELPPPKSNIVTAEWLAARMPKSA